MEPDSPTKAAVGVQSRAERRSTLEARWKKTPCTAENYQAGGQISGNKATVDENDASSSALRGDDDALWQSALSRFAQETSPTGEESGSNVHHEGDYPPTLSREQTQEQEDYRSGFNRGANDVGVLEIDTFEGESIVVDESSGLTATDDSTAQTEQSMGKLSLWQTCKVLYQRNPMIKFYIAGLLILLIASVAIVGVVLSQYSKSSNKDCATASYKDAQILLPPDESQPVRAGGFGTSIAASSEFLIVGAPDSECNSQEASCNPFTAGGGTYLYSRNSNNQQWELHSSFIFDDGVSSGDQYGKSVAIASDSTTVVVGSPENDSFGVVAGAIYVIEQPFGSTPAIRLVSEDLGVNDHFGGSVGVAATTIGSDPPVRVTNAVAGASYDDEFGFSSGTVYVFSKYNGKPPASVCGGNVKVGEWVQCQKLLPDDGQPHDQFGKAVDVSGNTIVVGSMWDDAKGIDSGEQRSGGKCPLPIILDIV